MARIVVRHPIVQGEAPEVRANHRAAVRYPTAFNKNIGLCGCQRMCWLNRRKRGCVWPSGQRLIQELHDPIGVRP